MKSYIKLSKSDKSALLKNFRIFNDSLIKSPKPDISSRVFERLEKWQGKDMDVIYNKIINTVDNDMEAKIIKDEIPKNKFNVDLVKALINYKIKDSAQGFQEFKDEFTNKSPVHQKNALSSKVPVSKVKIEPKKVNVEQFFEDLYDKSDSNDKLLIDSGIWDLAGIDSIEFDDSSKKKELFIKNNPITETYMVVQTHEVDNIFFLSKMPKKLGSTVKGTPKKDDIQYGVAGINMIIEDAPSRILIVGQND